MVIPISVIEKIRALPPGALRLVDKRVVAGDSNWAGQPVTQFTLHPKQTDLYNEASVKMILSIINEIRTAIDHAEARKGLSGELSHG